MGRKEKKEKTVLCHGGRGNTHVKEHGFLRKYPRPLTRGPQKPSDLKHEGILHTPCYRSASRGLLTLFVDDPDSPSRNTGVWEFPRVSGRRVGGEMEKTVLFHGGRTRTPW